MTLARICGYHGEGLKMDSIARSNQPRLRRQRQPASFLGGAALALLLAAGTAAATHPVRGMATSGSGTLASGQGDGPMASGAARYREGFTGIPQTGDGSCAPLMAHPAWSMAHPSDAQDGRGFFGSAPATRGLTAAAAWWTPYRRALSIPVWQYRTIGLPQGDWEIHINDFGDTSIHGTGPQEHHRNRLCPSAWRAPRFTL